MFFFFNLFRSHKPPSYHSIAYYPYYASEEIFVSEKSLIDFCYKTE